MMETKDLFHDAFVGEHRSTEATFEEMRNQAMNGDWSTLHARATSLSTELQVHIDTEEALVYPEVMQLGPDEDLSRTLAVLRKRHLEIPQYVLEIIENAEDEDTDETLASIDLLQRVLTEHHRSEETEIFPLFAPGAPLASKADRAAKALLEARS